MLCTVGLGMYDNDEENFSMAAHGKLEQFHIGQEDWDSYEEHLKQYFMANNIEKTKKQRAILRACEQATYKVILSLVALKKPKKCAYKDVVEHSRCYYSPKPLMIIQHCIFNMRYQQ